MAPPVLGLDPAGGGPVTGHARRRGLVRIHRAAWALPDAGLIYRAGRDWVARPLRSVLPDGPWWGVETTHATRAAAVRALETADGRRLDPGGSP